MRRRRCGWAQDALNIRHHDEEWGVPERDDRRLFEFLVLEGAQAGAHTRERGGKSRRKRRVRSRASGEQGRAGRTGVCCFAAGRLCQLYVYTGVNLCVPTSLKLRVGLFAEAK